MENFPPNSDKSKQQPPSQPGPPPDKNIKRVTSDEPKRRKKPLGTKIKETFFMGDGRTVFDNVIFEVMVPAVKNGIAESVSEAVYRILNGEGRRPRRPPQGYGQPQTGPTGYVSYNRYSMSQRDTDPPRQLTRGARSRHDFDEIVLSSHAEANEVVDRLYDLVAQYDSASVADLYELTGVVSNQQDQKWGWTDLHGAGVLRIRNGYLLNLPEPRPL